MLHTLSLTAWPRCASVLPIRYSTSFDARWLYVLTHSPLHERYAGGIGLCAKNFLRFDAHHLCINGYVFMDLGQRFVEAVRLCYHHSFLFLYLSFSAYLCSWKRPGEESSRFKTREYFRWASPTPTVLTFSMRF